MNPFAIFGPASGAIDKEKIDTEASAKTKSALRKFGAFVRRRALTSLRYRKGKSPSGRPPHAHRSERFNRVHVNKKTGATHKRPTSPLRELIVFALVDGGRAVIIGPMIFRASAVGGGSVPRLLEEGGTGTFLDRGKRKVGRWAPRPYMAPAFRAELPRARGLFERRTS